MNKKIHCRPAYEHGWLYNKKQIIMCIKMTIVIMIVSLSQVSANGFAQKITLSEKNISLEQLFIKIKKQSGYTFLYSPQLIKEAKPVSLEAKDQLLVAVLEKCFNGQPLTFAIHKQTIVVRKREEVPLNVIRFKLFKGKVVDAKGLAISGVTIKLKNKSTTRLTDENGEFNIDVEDDDVLILTYTGFKRKEVPVKGLQTLRIILEEDEALLKDVVVVGYGTQNRRETTASISSVKGTQLQNKPNASIEALLQGLVPGLLVQNNSGLPGGRSNVQLRGIAAFSNSANSNVVSTPLFIIDGVPLEQDVFNPSDPRQAITSVLSGFSPFDIESVDVLKDASATAIYGSRGANGVIVINTKRGKIGKPIVTLNSQFGLTYYPELRKTFGGRAERNFKIDLYNQYNKSSIGGITANDLPIELSDSLNTFYNNSTDWQKLYFKNANLKNINLGISGANENSSYRLGADFYDERGIVLGSGFNRYALTYSGVFNPTSKLTITGRANLSQTDASQRRGDTFNAAVVGNNFSSSFSPGPESGFFDAFLDSYNKGVNLDLTRRVLGQLEASYDIFKFLNITSRASANYEFYRTRSFSPSATRSDFKAAASYYSKENVNLLSETFVRLHHTFKEKHNFDFVVGNTINTSENNNIFGSAFGGPSDAQQVIRGYPQPNITLSTGNVSYGLLSYYSRLTYNYDRKYLLQGVVRADASSKFGKNKQWGYFPSLSAGWVFTRENFFSNNVGNWFVFGKLRASMGKAGEQYQDNYLALGAYNTGGTGNNATYNGVPILYPNYDGGNGVPLPNLTWQTSKEYGVGMDLEFFKSRLTFALDYYNKTKDGFLFPDAVNGTSGYSLRYINSGAVRNTGFEAAITGYITAPEKNFQYSVTFIGGTNKNILTKLPDFGRSITRGGYLGGSPYLQIGRPLNGFYLLHYLGVYPDDNAVPVNKYTGKKLFPNGSGFTSQDPYRAGDIKLQDVNGDGMIDIRGVSDKIYAGDPNPKFNGSLSHSFSYKLKNGSALQLDLFFNYSFGAKVYNKVLADRLRAVSWTASENISYPYGGQRNLLDVSDLNVWTPTNINAKYPVLNPWRYYATSSYDFIGNYDIGTDLFLENGSFVRLNNISLGYDFAPAFLKKLKVRRLRVYGGVNNVFIISKYSGVDPENVDYYGYDQGDGYPLPNKFNLGFNFEF